MKNYEDKIYSLGKTVTGQTQAMSQAVQKTLENNGHRSNKIINNILAKHKNPNFSKDLEMKLMMIVLNFFNIFLLLSDCCLL